MKARTAGTSPRREGNTACNWRAVPSSLSAVISTGNGDRVSIGIFGIGELIAIGLMSAAKLQPFLCGFGLESGNVAHTERQFDGCLSKFKGLGSLMNQEVDAGAGSMQFDEAFVHFSACLETKMVFVERTGNGGISGIEQNRVERYRYAVGE
jgi:hypothetical protein